MSQYATLPLQNDSVDELPLPPTPLNSVENPYRYDVIPERKSRTSTTSVSSSSSAKRSQSQPPNSLPPTLNGSAQKHNNSITPTQPAPTIERHKKPSRLSSNGYHTYNSHRSNSQLQYQNNDNSLDRRTHMRDMKMVRKIMNYLHNCFKSKFIYLPRYVQKLVCTF